MTAYEPPASPLEPETLDRLLGQVLQDDPGKVAGWIKSESGCWGFLAGKAIASCRAELGRSLADPERRLVWHRLWQLLEGIKTQMV